MAVDFLAAHKFLQLIVILRNMYHTRPENATKKLDNSLIIIAKDEICGTAGEAVQLKSQFFEGCAKVSECEKNS